MVSQKVVNPVETGVQGSCNYLKELYSGFRRNDKNGQFQTFYEIIRIKGRGIFSLSYLNFWFNLCVLCDLCG